LPLPTPHPGLVICYSYLWASEHRSGREEGAKDRPCAIVVARRLFAEATVVTVVPVTHTPPSNADEAIEIPAPIKAHLGLDDQRSWIVVSEVNDFVWPGPDLRPVPGAEPVRYDYGVLPPGFFRKLRDQLLTLRQTRRVQAIPRTQ
jgi:PemK-like, MazF-like toxin of type II toxin-antitoxin system